MMKSPKIETTAAQAMAGTGNNQDNSVKSFNFYGLKPGEGDLKELLKTSDGRGKKENFENWHIVMPERSMGLLEFPESAAKLGALIRDGQLVLECADSSILHDACAWISSQTRYGQRLLVSRLNPAFYEESDQVPLAAYVNHLGTWWESQAASINGPLLVVFHLEGRLLADVFLSSLNMLCAGRGARRHIHLVFMTFPETRELITPAKLRGHIEVWRLPAVPLLIKRAVGAEGGGAEGEARLQKLLQNLQTQRQQRKWASDETAYVREIGILLEPGNALETLEQEVALRSAAPGQNFDSLERHVSAEQMEVARRGSLMERAVLFTAAFCGRCSIHEQKLILESLLKGSMVKPESKTASALKHARWRLPATKRQEKNTDTGVVEAEQPVDAYDLWLANDEDIRERCGLVRVTGPEGTRHVEFAQESMCEMARQTLSDSFVMVCFEAVSHRMIFHLEASPMLVEKLVGLAAEMCVRYPDRFGDAWLRDVLESIHKVWALSVAAEISNLGQWYKELQDLLKEKGILLSRLTQRLAALCEAMLERPASKVIAMRFIDSLLSEGAYGIVIRLAKRLRRIEPDACFRWIKRCLNQAPEDDRETASDTLFEIAQASPLELDQVIGVVFNWLPEEGREVEKTSNSERFAMVFPLLLRQNLGAQGPELFSQDGTSTSQQRWELMVRWLCHPKVWELLEAARDRWNHPDEILAYNLVSWVVMDGAPSQLLIDQFRVLAQPRQVMCTRNVFGELLGEADKEYLQAADLSYRHPTDEGKKRACARAKKRLTLLKETWRRLGERSPKA